MKTRILPLLGFLFATALFGKAFAVSSDAANEILGKHATEQSETEKAHQQKSGNTTAPQHTPAVDAPLAAPCVTGDVLVAINEKMQALEVRETEMAKKTAAFLAIEDRVQKQLKVIQVAKASLDEGVAKRTKLAHADIDHLTLMYQTMKPKQAAKIFNEMDVKFAAGFLRNMKGGQAGLILSNMNAKKAYEISLIMASTNAKYRQDANNNP